MLRTGLTFVLRLSLIVGLVLLGPGARMARADLVSTAAILGADREAGHPDRQRVHGFLDREDVQAQLEEFGIPSDEAHSRVAALTDAEIAEINGRLDQLPAGGLVGTLVGIILVLFLVLVITDLLGVTDVFAFIDPLPRGQTGSLSN